MSTDLQRQERVVRLLNLVAYASNHADLTVMEIARDLGADPQQVRDDLDLLYMSGVGTGPGEMIELEHSWKGVRIIDDQGLTKPLRLTPVEASALLVLLDSLETMPGLVDARAVRSAADKIRAATTSSGIGDAEHPTTSSVASTVADVLSAKKQLEVTYYSATSDTTSKRTIEPASLFHEDGNTYLRAADAGEMKTFRLDRIREAVLLDEPSTATDTDFDSADPFGMALQAKARLLIHPDATWLADYWDIDIESDVIDSETGWIPATMHYGSGDWLIRFCLGQADRVRIQEPADLAAELEARVNSALEALD